MVGTVFELPGGLGGWTPYLTLPTPYLWSKFYPGGSSFNPPPKFCWSWYVAWFTVPSNAVLKISRPASWWFECYYCSEMRYKSLWLPPARIRFLLLEVI